MIRGLMIDFGGTVDTDGVHWYNMFRKAYSLCGVDLSDELLRDAYVNAERTLGRNRMINPDYTFRKTLEIKTATGILMLICHAIPETALPVRAIRY
jgi:putative hydrolase of the HAD superfamily